MQLAQSLVEQPPLMDMDVPPFGMDSGGYSLPAALLAQYPALAHINFAALGPMEDDGRSFDASDYEEGDDAGYTSGPGAFGGGGSSTGGGGGGGGSEQAFGEMGYASDYSAR